MGHLGNSGLQITTIAKKIYELGVNTINSLAHEDRFRYRFTILYLES